jgi:UTP--glucose-1-phosphate uridylyltransferase
MKAIILAAWHGTRMLPITKTIPKELLPVGNKPVIHYIVEWLSKAGINDMLIITSQSKKALEDYFDKNYELEDILTKKWKTDALKAINEPKDLGNFTFVKQTEQKGTGHAILQAKPWIQDEFFMVVYADEIHHPKIYTEMLDLHSKSGKSVILWKEVSPDEVSKYWILQIENNFITDIIEKPSQEEAPSNYALFTPFIFPRKLFDLLEQIQPDSNSWEVYPWDWVKHIMKTDWVVPYISTHPMRDASGNPESRLATNIAFANNPHILD